MKNFFALITVVALSACSEKQEKIPPPAPTPTPAAAAVVAATPPANGATLNEKILMKCAAVTNSVERLSCFDDFTRANNLAPSTTESTASAESKWRTSTDTDPLTDKSIHYATVIADEGSGRHGDNITMIVRCKSGKTETFINWSTFLGSDGIAVTSRVDKAPASTSQWAISTDHMASFMPQSVATLKRLDGASTFVVNLTPYSESPITAIFDVSGASEAFNDIRRDCKW